jgi:phospholipid/cholesterol/gamma-HCH transport system permease protein
MVDSQLNIEFDKHHNRINIQGQLDIYNFAKAEKELTEALDKYGDDKVFDLSGVTSIDTAGAMLLQKMQHLKFENVRPQHKGILNLVSKTKISKPSENKTLLPFFQMLVRLGKATIQIWYSIIEFITFMGQAFIALGRVIRHPKHVRFSYITHHIEETGINALPIIGLIAFIISVVLAYQSQAQLKPLGAEQYTVNLIAISVLREMGVLLTAIMIAGRSGSAFTAEIGTMQVRQEIDALHSMGIEPFEILVLPRLIALLITLPLLTFFANMMGLFGGALLSMSLIDMSVPEYIERLRHAVTWKDFLVGMIKAPVFAFVIALVGCMHGMKVSGSSESVGRETTASVVEAIFIILILDGLFSIYFEKVNL